MNKFGIACIIDDDPIFVFGTKRLMRINEFCNGVIVFSNGQEAIEHLRPALLNQEVVPEVIFLDINMPIMDGWDFLDEFIAIPIKHQIIIYIVSSSIDPADTKRALEYEAVSNYIIKPITQKALMTMLAAN